MNDMKEIKIRATFSGDKFLSAVERTNFPEDETEKILLTIAILEKIKQEHLNKLPVVFNKGWKQ